MTTRPKPGPRLVRTQGQPSEAATPRLHANMADLAYDRLEELIVTCALPPGMFLSIQDLQQQTGLGRTPIHQAVSRLAADTLFVIRPRHGLQIAPIDLARDRTLLRLRRDMERFVVRLASERASASHRDQLLHIAGALRTRNDGVTIGEFNQLDRKIDRVLTAAAGEAFLDHTMRPLHSIFRRIGWIYHSQVRSEESLAGTLEGHLAILDAVAAGHVTAAVAASDALIAFVDSMFDVLGRGVHPALFDCNLDMRAVG